MRIKPRSKANEGINSMTNILNNYYICNFLANFIKTASVLYEWACLIFTVKTVKNYTRLLLKIVNFVNLVKTVNSVKGVKCLNG